MEGTNSVIHVEDLTMAYRETPVLWDIDLDVPECVRCAIVGPNGAGKSQQYLPQQADNDGGKGMCKLYALLTQRRMAANYFAD